MVAVHGCSTSLVTNWCFGYCQWPDEVKTLKLYKAVNIDGCSWTLGSGQIVVTLEKCAAEPWPQLLKEVEGLYLWDPWVEKFEAGCFGCKLKGTSLQETLWSIWREHWEHVCKQAWPVNIQEYYRIQGSTETGDHSFRLCKFQTWSHEVSYNLSHQTLWRRSHWSGSCKKGPLRKAEAMGKSFPRAASGLVSARFAGPCLSK